MLPKVHAQTRDEREVIILNSLGQPVGPTRKIVQEFKQFLGTVARDSELAPLNYINFPSLLTLDKMWEYVQAINGSWKAHKCFTKRNYFSAYPTDALRWFHKPDTISEPQFRELLQYWHSKEAEEISKINKDNRQMLDDMHTMGRNSYAILRHKLKQQDPDKQEPSQARVYKESRKRTVGRKYLTNHEKIEENIAKMDALESSQHEDRDGSNSKDPYSEVIPDPKRKSRVRLQGKGVKKSDLKKKDKKSDFIFRTEFLESMQSQLVQQLAPSVTTAILTQLRDANPGINLVIPDFAIPSAPKDASSAPHLLVDQNGKSSKSGATINQVT
uniref:Transposase n=1 Tax=Chenopodium quinoa TaxID=63459 RepID=A0A803MQV7_CHEQI